MGVVWLVVALLVGSFPDGGWALTYYLSPTGTNTVLGGTLGNPWRTFAYAIPRLAPGDTLLLHDGTYLPADNGMPMLFVNCAGGGNAVSGTAAQPITIKAVNERQASLQGNGANATVYLTSCGYWILEGLHISNVDLVVSPSIDGTVLAVGVSHHLILRRNLIHHNNRYTNSHGIGFYYSHNSLIEENEVYSVHRHGILLFGDSAPDVPSFNVLRRNYLHSRDATDVGGGYPSGDSSRGDVGISCYPCRQTLFENNVAENWEIGYDIQAKTNAINNTYLGNIALNNRLGVEPVSRSDITSGVVDGMPQNTQYTNLLVVGSSSIGGYFRSSKNSRCDNCTFIDGGASGGGLSSDDNSGTPGDGAATLYGTNVLIANNAGSGFNLNNLADYSFDHILVFNNAGGNNPGLGDSHFTNVLTVDPQLGACKVFIPGTSPAKGAGVGGTDIGANLLVRYENTAVTSVPLWDPSTSRFPCGAVVAGVNDLAGQSCIDVHTRLNVNANGCTLPSLAALPPPTNFRLVP